ncbi:methylmalonyl Co-A mutase-associated GTPase MeaB [Mariniflexile maritimum]|uniref:methylmalonyl Co-A mutase-associated GTPase MeaB n=1 Tax=Mariniflexile maritimum TaxID=2682493 RepID=UPI0012F633CB|nr:methylmalonyl Co-A mutase-associated GTPase MeaB [Mariniflexile maritimum]MCB0448899.1 methylmalonyl Co-A mutase-associated GTPase MeaB [Confluentibacter sp.]HMQ44231.1 methylmalonyl Co-A mutase-associated GTPase MeaB [Mariniflexile sp.]HMR16233.1 methylmalonyl Co-A mutase-associated GTPase MeaB [Mariniflexile sp.]
MKNYKPKNRLTAQAYIDGVLSGNRVILSRAITIIESNLETDKALAKEIIQSILPASGNSMRIGITGVPGVGKSTFIEAFGKHLITQGHKVAILSIDPSSQRSKGSILGDKTRMEELSNLENAYIRPSASGATLGGVANKTAESMLLCEAAGYDVILIETVGVGQSETAVHGMTDFFLLLMLAGAGDELQGIKKGIMEMADMVVINKADGDNIRKSELARLQYQNALHIFPLAESGWEPIVTKASSTKNTGIDTVWEEVLKYKQLVTTNGYFHKNRNQQKIRWMYDNINEALKQLFYGSKEIAEQLSVLEKNIISSEISPVKAAEEMIEKFKKTF